MFLEIIAGLLCLAAVGALLVLFYLVTFTLVILMLCSKFSILDLQMKKHNETKTLPIHSVRSKGLIREVTLIERDELLRLQAKELLAGDRLTVLCELRILLPQINKSTLMLPPVTPPLNSLRADLGSLLRRGLHSDVILVAEGKMFRAHKNILSARSPAFEAAFQHDTRESDEKYVYFQDVSADTVEKMLQHIYTGEVSNLEQSAESLLEVADRYKLESLKSLCEVPLRLKLDVKNTARLLVLADKHHADQLKADCMSFIVAHPREVQETLGWKVLENEQHDLLVEVSKKLLI